MMETYERKKGTALNKISKISWRFVFRKGKPRGLQSSYTRHSSASGDSSQNSSMGSFFFSLAFW